MSKSVIQKKMGNVLASFEAIRNKVEGLCEEYGTEAVKAAFKDLEAERDAKDALKKLIEGVWAK